ncbi:DNA/RNA non-specific endonuclease [Porphyromonas circumdentaria]|uniref:DNA/RNA non-specific endonuclease n=1 Tax=Porphyromonas circumdentaria TaxID=29524 RepID=UPI0026DA9E41|nr:DNA/RNA non-specific endonuclease [Porphyromonas circumdentaria]MDO4721983.1 DNA/RNA non-specific endonuclease [Porphyromonas circumdentaria]
MRFFNRAMLKENKSRFQISLLAFVVSFLLQGASCEKRPPYNDPELKVTNATNGHSIVFSPNGGSQTLFLKSPCRWVLSVKPSSADWLRLGKTNGDLGAHQVFIEVVANETAEREVYVYLASNDNQLRDSVRIVQQGKDGLGSLGDEHILGDIDLIELPRFSGSKEDYFVTHRVEKGQRVNFSLEYHTPLHHARWVCFSFDEVTRAIHTKRTDAWGWDPFVPTEFEVGRLDYKGFDRGHLVASFDRVFSKEANAQTFYYTNMSPQRAKFNQVAWQQLERTVQDWVRSPGLAEKMYVAKGGTLREGEYELTSQGKKIAVPKHYWMAILVQSGTVWRGLAFWIGHERNKEQEGGLAPLTCSIDELEQKTGLDFFFNLPDEVEQEVEAQIPSEYKNYWPGL